jgi:hypothetical protein
VGLYVESDNVGILCGKVADPINGVGVEVHTGTGGGTTAFWAVGSGLGLGIDSEGTNNGIEVTVTGRGTGTVINMLGAYTVTSPKPCLQLIGSGARAPLNLGVVPSVASLPTPANSQDGDVALVINVGAFYLYAFLGGAWRRTVLT